MTKQTSDKKIVAWRVTDEDEHDVIVFHHHGLAARRKGAEMGICHEFEDVFCSRAPEFDQYAEQGRVPDDVLLANGWWFSCDACYNQTFEDNLHIGQAHYCDWKCFVSAWWSKLKGVFK